MLDFLNQDADTAARHLLGCLLVRDLNGGQVVARIVETEAYDQNDAASHSYRGPTPRNRVMFGPAGRLYVYLSYGIHYCANIVCGPDGFGSGALIRAVESLEGIELVRGHRPGVDDRNLTNGPGKLAQALKINFDLSGHDLTEPSLRLVGCTPVDSLDVINTTRIGISKERERLRRFYVKSSEYVSRR